MNNYARSGSSFYAWCRNNLKTHSCGLLSKAGFGPLDSFSVMSDEDRLVIRLLGSQHVIHDPRELMRRCRYCLRCSEFSSHAPIELTKVIVGVMHAMGTHSKAERNSVLDCRVFV